MNPELQKSLQVTALSNTLDSYMLVILLIMIAAGILGGVANYFLSERAPDSSRSDWSKYPILGGALRSDRTPLPEHDFQ